MPLPAARRAELTLARSRALSRLALLPLALLPLALLPLALLCLSPLRASAQAAAPAPKNSILSLRTVRVSPTLTTYDVTVTSSAPFPMGDAVVTLNIGGREFINSRYVPGGTLNTLVFSLSRGQFLSLKSGAPVAVYYGQDNATIAAAQWNFGALDLSRLDKVAPPSPPVAGPAPPRSPRIITVTRVIKITKTDKAPAPRSPREGTR